MIKNKRMRIVGCALFFVFLQSPILNAKISYERYFTKTQITQNLNQLTQKGNGLSSFTMSKSAGGNDLILFSAISDKSNPAIFVAANMSGNLPIASSGAVYLAEYLNDHPELYSNYSWYILPCGNPDAYSNNIDLQSFPYNATSVNKDMDDKTDEDGREDLNSDGFMGMMRKADPNGSYAVNKKEARLMMNATDTVAAVFRYKLYSEGIDNDRDGKYNEDGPGGVNIAKTFPYNYDYLSKESGRWSGSEKETFAILNFFSEHPEICMTVTLGESDFLRSPFIKAQKESAVKKYSPPARYAAYFGLDAKRKYTMKEMQKEMHENKPEANVDETYVFKMLNTGTLKAPIYSDKADFDFLSKSYLAFLKKNKYETKHIDPLKPAGGSFELWSYYHLGIPSLALRLWDIPVLKNDSVKSKKKLSREESFLVYSDSLLKGNGFAAWQSFKHPDLGEVEIGGIKSGYIFNPQESEIQNVLAGQIPWLGTLMNHMPEISVLKVETKNLSKNMYQLEVYLTNSGRLSWPLHIGDITRRPAPLVLLIGDSSAKFIQGKSRTTVSSLGAGAARKYTYVIQTDEDELNLSFDAKNVRVKSQTINLK